MKDKLEDSIEAMVYPSLPDYRSSSGVVFLTLARAIDELSSKVEQLENKINNYERRTF